MHFDTLETRFAFRTRMLDYIWSGLPMVVTGGDATSELVTRFNLGQVVPSGDERAITEALDSLLETPSLRETLASGFEAVRPHLTWDRVCEPIARFCAQPRFAPDRASADGSSQKKTGMASVGGAQPRSAPTAAQLERQQDELERLRTLVQGYEQGRFIRLTCRLDDWRRKLGL